METTRDELARTEVYIADEPIDPHSLQGELQRLSDYIGTLSDNLDRHGATITSVLRPAAEPGLVGERLKDPSQPSELTERLHNLNDRLSVEIDRVSSLTNRVDL